MSAQQTLDLDPAPAGISKFALDGMGKMVEGQIGLGERYFWMGGSGLRGGRNGRALLYLLPVSKP